MKKQGYNNHKMYYAPHHFILLPLLGVLLGVGIKNSFSDTTHQLEWVLFSTSIFCTLYVTVMLRQHYALGNQDRIIRLEFRLRYLELLGGPSKNAEEKLSFAQMAALRFADDDEFKVLLQRTLAERLSGDAIKKAITNWQPDDMRL